MMFLPALLFIILPFSLAAPASQPEPLATYKVESFDSFVSSQAPETNSYASFFLTDPSSDHSFAGYCTISGSIYRKRYTTCGSDTDQTSFLLSEGELVIRRGLYINGQDITTYARQGTYWKPDVNVTKGDLGTTFTRTTAWLFPVQSASLMM